MALLPGILEALFSNEHNDLRFEQVCLDLYRAAEGINLVPTSRSWDMGRDGRSISISGTGKALSEILCATLSTSLNEKIEKDIRRLSKTTLTKAIVYCSSRPLSEKACDDIEAKIRDLAPSVESVRVLGQIQLIHLSLRNEMVIQNHYPAEIHTVEQALLRRPDLSEGPEKIGLRLALMTQTGDDAFELRNDLSRRLVLECLDAEGTQNPGDIAVKISNQLHLGQAISIHYIRQILSQLHSDNLINIQNGAAQLTPVGADFLKIIPSSASSKLLEGRSTIRIAIKKLSGHELLDTHYERLWDTLQDGLSDLFYHHGDAIIRMVGSLISGEEAEVRIEARELFDRLAARVLPLFTDQDQGKEVQQAILDMFCEKESDAFEWLTHICSVYVMMCSLGFEAFSSEQISRVLTTFQMIADTDVVISLVCEEEKNSYEVSRIINGWRALGGKLLMAIPVLEEVAYHAWISKYDYATMGNQLPHLSDDNTEHLIGNAFVRTFKRLAYDQRKIRHWDQYINQFRGDSKYDYSRIMEILREDYGFKHLPDAEEKYGSFSAKIEKFMKKSACKRYDCELDDLDENTVDKLHRDAKVIASLKAAREASRQGGIPSIISILSSAKLMKEVDNAFRQDFGKPDAVVSTAVLGCLLILTPDIKMGLQTLRGVLFDLDLVSRMSRLEQYALRLIHASKEFDIHWSRRVSVRRELSEKLYTEAQSRGEKVSDIRQRVIASEDPTYSAKMVVDTMDRMAITPGIESSLTQAERRIKELEETIKQMSSRGEKSQSTKSRKKRS